MSLHTLDKELVEIETSFAQIEREFPEIARTAAKARLVYDIAYATQFDEIKHRAVVEGGKKPTDKDAEMEATLAVQEEMGAARMAEAELLIATTVMKSLDKRLSSKQTRSKFIFVEKGLEGFKA